MTTKTKSAPAFLVNRNIEKQLSLGLQNPDKRASFEDAPEVPDTIAVAVKALFSQSLLQGNAA